MILILPSGPDRRLECQLRGTYVLVEHTVCLQSDETHLFRTERAATAGDNIVNFLMETV